MTIRFLRQWNGYDDQDVVSLSASEETRLVSLGLATFTTHAEKSVVFTSFGSKQEIHPGFNGDAHFDNTGNTVSYKDGVEVGARLPFAVAARTRMFVNTFTPPYSKDAPPVPLANSFDIYQDVVVAAQVGDIIALETSTYVACPVGSGLVLSIWSIGGSDMRDWTTGKLGLQATKGVCTIPAGNGTGGAYTIGLRAYSGCATNTILASDLDVNGNAIFRVYGANSVSGAFTYTNSQNPSALNFIAKNLMQNDSNLPVTYQAFPTDNDTNLVFTPPAAVPFIPVSSTFELKLKADILDLIEVDFALICNISDVWYSVLSVGGSAMKCVYKSNNIIDNLSAGNLFPAILASKANEYRVGKGIFKVWDTDLDANGYVTLRVYSRGTGVPVTIYSNGVSGNDPSQQTFLSAKNWGTDFSYNGLYTKGSISPGELTAYVDKDNQVNAFYSANGGGAGIDAITAPTPRGPWRLLKSQILSDAPIIPAYGESSCFLDDDGQLYFYYCANRNGIGVAVGTNPLDLVGQATMALDPAGQVSYKTDTFANQSVCKGPNDLYYMAFEAQPADTTFGYATWFMGVATSKSPLGPFKVVPGSFPIKTLSASNFEFTASVSGTTLTLLSDIVGVGSSLFNAIVYIAANNEYRTIQQLATGEHGKTGATYTLKTSGTTTASSACTSISHTGHPQISYDGNRFNMLYHSSVVPGDNTPLLCYAAYSYDCVKWFPTAINKSLVRKANSNGQSGQINPLHNNAIYNGYGSSLEGSCGNPWIIKHDGKNFLYFSVGIFNGTVKGTNVTNPEKIPLNIPFTSNIVTAKSPMSISASANSTFAMPANTIIERIVIKENANIAVTGGINIGTAALGAQVLSAVAVGANSSQSVVPIAGGSVFSVDTTLYLSAVTAWAGANVEVIIFFRLF